MTIHLSQCDLCGKRVAIAVCPSCGRSCCEECIEGACIVCIVGDEEVAPVKDEDGEKEVEGPF